MINEGERSQIQKESIFTIIIVKKNNVGGTRCVFGVSLFQIDRV